MYYVRKLSSIGSAEGQLFGDYGANLGQTASAGLAVPPGFCVGTEAYLAFVALTRADKTIARLLAGLQMGDQEDLEVRAEQIRNFLYAQQVPACIAEEILQAYYELSVEVGSRNAPVPVALFASSPSRDIESMVCLRPVEAFLNVSGEAELLDHVKRCWGTLWTARSVACRVRQGAYHLRAAVKVIVQAMIEGI